ncbi:hypothetical protein [Nitrosomonas sp.]|uniref:hypothetical protein n=1 Tax=Nitrosomonas sp. TaxID=42353 RepID=UPI001DDDAEF1|nr:hypothetical protein [Nitrosomonas sp.]MBX3615532.1 hypothetical protein [Nitrosomonas sp.]
MQSMKMGFMSYVALAMSVIASQVVMAENPPSNEDVEKSIKIKSDEAIQQLEKAGVMPQHLRPTIHGIKKLGCAAARGEAGYICDVESDVFTPATGRIKAVEKYRLVKKSDGWVSIGKVE